MPTGDMRTRIFILLWVLFGCVSLRASQSALTIAVKVSGGASNEISSYIKRELRELKDVSIVDIDAATLIVEVISIETPNQSGGRTGYALSVITVSPFATETMSNLLTAALSKRLSQPTAAGLAPAVGGYLEGMVKLEDHSVWFSLPDELKGVCQKIVAHVDAEILETQRMAWAKFEHLMEEQGWDVVATTNKSAPIDFKPRTNSPSK